MNFSSVPKNTQIVFTNEEVTGPPAREMIRLLNIDDTSIVLDNATGGGVAALAGKAQYAADIDDSMLSLAGSRGLQTIKADQAHVPLDAESFTHITNAFGVFFSAKDEDVLKETLRLLKPDGLAGFTSWKLISWWPEVASEMPLTLPDPVSLFPAKWDDSDIIRQKMTNAGFKDVDVKEFSFNASVDASQFAEATAVLINTIAKRAWAAEDFDKYSSETESRILGKIKQVYGDTYSGSLTALITIGRKAS